VKQLSLLFVLLLSLFCAGVTAEDATVKVIALFSNKAFLQVGDKQKVVSKGETFEGVLLQSASGRGAVVVIDGETMTLGLNQSIATNFKKRDRVTIRIASDASGMYYARGYINGHSTSFLVDTGATNVTLSGSKANALGIDFRQGVPGMANTAASVVQVWQIKLSSVRIGGIELNNVKATVIPGTKPSDVLLGNSFLGRTEIQQANSVLTIKKRF
jgi:aspartyl protease family protein